MQMIELKVSDLIGPPLDWAVDQIVGGGHEPFFDMPSYSTDWSQGGPLIEMHQVTIEHEFSSYFAVVPGGMAEGKTHLIAGCRAIVVANLGDVVQVPAALMEVARG